MRDILVLFFVLLLQFGYASDIHYYKNGKKVSLSSVHISKDKNTPNFYKTSRGIVLGITDRLIVKLKNSSYLKQMIDTYNLSMEKRLGRNLYLLKTIDKNLTIDTANILSKKAYIEYAQPDFIKKRISR